MKYFIYLLNIPIYYFSFLIPKRKNIWVFGEWFGQKYTDNSKALYEYVNLVDNEVNAIWLTENKEIILQLRERGLRAYNTYSFMGYYYSILAKYVFVSTGMHDVNRYACATKYKIQLWHGTALKKIMYDTETTQSSGIVKFIKRIIFPFNDSKYEILTSSSDDIIPNYRSAFREKAKNIIVTGYPRNDALFQERKENIITFLPTHRGEGNGIIKKIFEGLKTEKLQGILEKYNHTFLIKPHFYDINYINIEETDRIKVLKEDISLYHLLSKTHILVTDYSSVYFDFLVLDRPIIFTPFDFDEYLKERQLYFEYAKCTPGPKCRDWKEFNNELEIILGGLDSYAEQREKVCSFFNKYSDSSNSKRVYDYIKSI